MNWYYAHEGQQIGPVSDEEFQNLRTAGGITGETLIWREGIAEWRPCAEAMRSGAGPVETPLAEPARLAMASVICTGCGGSFAAEEVVRMGDGFVCAKCKPLAVQRMREGVASNEAEEIRNEHIKHEASVKSIGVLYIIGAVVLLVSGGFAVYAGTVVNTSRPGLARQPAFFLGYGLAFICIGMLQFAVALGIRRFKPWARVAGGILSGLGLVIGFPVGTIVNAYILYLLFSAKGRMVFSDEYREIVEQTPHVKYRTSIVVWIFLALLLVIAAGVVIAALFSTRR